MKRDIIILIALFIALGVSITMLFTSCEMKTYQSDELPMAEWISPDGVHYWFSTGVYQAYMAPRYDANGELVIDN